jgi:hypothetical protein
VSLEPADAPIAECLHCHRTDGLARWKRRLCHRCYADKEIRVLYPCQRHTGQTIIPECLHCHVGKPHRRGLCHDCYYNPQIRPLYGAISKFGNKVHLIEAAGQRPNGPPTDALPGTEAKLVVLCERARRRQNLFHPLDAKLPEATDQPAEVLAKVLMSEPPPETHGGGGAAL